MSDCIRIVSKGDFSKTTSFLKKSSNIRIDDILSKYGQEGVDALSLATPKDTGKTANSWYYTISKSKGRYTISWNNSNVVNGVPIAVILQYGHGTRTGGFVSGRDYINPVTKKIFDKIANDAWKEVVTV